MGYKMMYNFDPKKFSEVNCLAKKSNCLSRKVGCIIVDKEHKLLATGYNEQVHGQEACITCKRYQELSGTRIAPALSHEVCLAVHAEQMAICNAAISNRSIKGGIMYVSTEPCVVCAKLIISAKICAVYYLDRYNGKGSKLLEDAGINVKQVMLKG